MSTTVELLTICLDAIVNQCRPNYNGILIILFHFLSLPLMPFVFVFFFCVCVSYFNILSLFSLKKKCKKVWGLEPTQPHCSAGPVKANGDVPLQWVAVLHKKKSLNMGPIFWLSQIFEFSHGENPENRKIICDKWAYFSRKILNSGYLLLSKWPLKMGRGFEAQTAHPRPNQIWVPPGHKWMLIPIGHNSVTVTLSSNFAILTT